MRSPAGSNADDGDEYRSELDFVGEFELVHGRPLRVLHIGNIANNAYNNALIQRRFGVEADTICYNYYHVMGCPEWEAASFDGSIDSLFPDWWATELGGWQRPDWFVQGSVGECLSYLRAKNAGDKAAATYFWTLLQAKYWQMLDDIAAAQGRTRPPMPNPLAHALSIEREYSEFKAQELLKSYQPPIVPDPPAVIVPEPPPVIVPEPPSVVMPEPPSVIMPEPPSVLSQSATSDGPNRLALVYRSYLTKTVFVHLRREAETGIRTGFKLDLAAWRFQRHLRGLPYLGFEFSPDFFKLSDDGIGHSKPTVSAVEPTVSAIDNERLREPPTTDVEATVSVDQTAAVSVDRDASLDPVSEPDPIEKPDLIEKPEFRFLEQYGKGNDNRALQREAVLGRVFRQFQQFPADALRTVDVFASTVANQFADVLEYYDVIQGYSTDGFIPFVNGFENYACYEHGTLREIPFEKTYNAITCTSSYKNAAVSFVTNSDVLPSVKRLKLERARTVFLPHAFDDRKTSDFVSGSTTPELNSDVTTFFSPTRHHWHTEPASMQKGNEVFLRAAARLAQANRNFRIMLVEWGVDVQRSKDLIRSLGIEDLVAWRPTLNKAELREAYLSCHAVVDQFVIPAMGGVTFEAMALGRRVITRLDEAQTAEFFGAAPPCLTADSVESCAARISEVLHDPTDEAGRGDAARLWFKKYHSARRVVALQLAAYRKIIRFDLRRPDFVRGNMQEQAMGFLVSPQTHHFPISE
jgi:glycosyltransferase involved in cell wall biosynthesis